MPFLPANDGKGQLTPAGDGNNYFSTVADLRSLPKPTLELVYVGDPYIKKWYRWDPNSTATDDGVSVIKLNSVATGRFLVV